MADLGIAALERLAVDADADAGRPGCGSSAVTGDETVDRGCPVTGGEAIEWR
jgi:hypothetical protein